MDKDKIIDYVMNSPANTNKAVLEGMLDGVDGGGSNVIVITANIIQNGDSYSIDSVSHTYDEMTTLLNSGKTLCADCAVHVGAYPPFHYMLWFFSDAYNAVAYKGISTVEGLSELRLTIPKNGESTFTVKNIS